MSTEIFVQICSFPYELYKKTKVGVFFIDTPCIITVNNITVGGVV